ncbi:unnamed protein product, partial [Ectocarpus sp. 4 AP-2014]
MSGYRYVAQLRTFALFVVISSLLPLHVVCVVALRRSLAEPFALFLCSPSIDTHMTLHASLFLPSYTPACLCLGSHMSVCILFIYFHLSSHPGSLELSDIFHSFIVPPRFSHSNASLTCGSVSP